MMGYPFVTAKDIALAEQVRDVSNDDNPAQLEQLIDTEASSAEARAELYKRLWMHLWRW